MSVKQNFNLLKWDTEQFGYKIASVRPVSLEQKNLELLINELENINVKLAYCFVDPSDLISNNSLINSGVFLADEKITFITTIEKDSTFEFSSCIAPYKLNYTSEKLKSLALQSGLYSRFKMDINFVNHEYEQLYSEWIDKSVKMEMADEILVYYKEDDEKGFVTLNIKNGVGSIGLVAVDEKERGNSIGKELMKAALWTFKNKGICTVEVVTQKANRIACEFYKALGFTIGNVENIYHLWIK
ncbi:MAG: GNAT family N-acetyltransferase [Bacteroidales bacterium]